MVYNLSLPVWVQTGPGSVLTSNAWQINLDEGRWGMMRGEEGRWGGLYGSFYVFWGSLPVHTRPSRPSPSFPLVTSGFGGSLPVTSDSPGHSRPIRTHFRWRHSPGGHVIEMLAPDWLWTRVTPFTTAVQGGSQLSTYHCFCSLWKAKNLRLPGPSWTRGATLQGTHQRSFQTPLPVNLHPCNKEQRGTGSSSVICE